jgi:hypothetical protein
LADNRPARAGINHQRRRKTMAITCKVTGLALDANGVPLPNAVINITRYGELDGAFPSEVTSDANGAFEFVVPQGARLLFHSNDVAGIDGVQVDAPRSENFNLGNFRDGE